MSRPAGDVGRRRRPGAPRALYAALTAAALAACASAPQLPEKAPVPPVATAAAAPSEAMAAPTPPREFSRWIADMRIRAKSAGIDEATLDAAFGTVRFLPQLIDLDRTQPEFNRPVWDYLDTAVSPQRVARGREKMAAIRREADAAAARYGVPAEVLVAIWGMESNYGTNYGDISTIDALATLGFEGRREAWARTELLAALRILQRGDIDRGHMVGSWAGAMGQTQFLPSTFLAYAVDADGDGRRDIWNSMADVMASTAHFLASSGWRAGEPWGTEVRLPAGFDIARADTGVVQSTAGWAAEGVTSATGQALLPDFASATLHLPAGARGPAFLLGSNFSAVLRYNNSSSYALAVGLLAQRLAGGPGVQAAWPRDSPALSRGQIVAIQSALGRLGFDCGEADGLFGPATRAAFRKYQGSVGLLADGFPDAESLRRLFGS